MKNWMMQQVNVYCSMKILRNCALGFRASLCVLILYHLVSEKHSCALVSDPEVEKEKQELAMLDDILAKAQHARNIQNKVSSVV